MEDTQKQTENVPREEDKAHTADKDKPAFCNKFATADELEKAYDNLQREFTKKCQQNSELSRALKQTAQAVQKCGRTDGEPRMSQTEGREKETSTETECDCAKTPVYDSPEWENKVSEFFREYPAAQRYTDKIAKALASDADLAKRGDCLERAYFAVLRQADRPYEEIAGDESFLEKYVYGNQKVKDRIIEEFLRKNTEVVAPRVIAASGRTNVTPPSRPKSIREAGGIVKNMLANRRI